MFEGHGEEVLIKMHLENNIIKPIVVLRQMGRGDGDVLEMTDRQRAQQ